MSEREVQGKEGEKEEEKGRGVFGSEKYRRDPVSGVVVAACLIWGAVVWIWYQAVGLPPNVEAWSVGLIGAGVIVLLGVVFRLLVPAYRRPLGGGIILGVVLLGVGLGEIVSWVIIGPLVLIAIALSILVGLGRRR